MKKHLRELLSNKCKLKHGEISFSFARSQYLWQGHCGRWILRLLNCLVISLSFHVIFLMSQIHPQIYWFLLLLFLFSLQKILLLFFEETKSTLKFHNTEAPEISEMLFFLMNGNEKPL